MLVYELMIDGVEWRVAPKANGTLCQLMGCQEEVMLLFEPHIPFTEVVAKLQETSDDYYCSEVEDSEFWDYRPDRHGDY